MSVKNFDKEKVIPVYIPNQADKKFFKSNKTPDPKRNRILISFIFLATLAICMSLAGVWLYIGQIEESVPGQGQIAPVGKIRRIMSPMNGIVSKLHVTENQEVKAGQVLIELDPQMTEIEQSGIMGELALYQEEASAINDAYNSRSSGRYGGFHTAWLNATRDSFTAQMSSAKMQIQKISHQYRETLERYKKEKSILNESEKMLIQYQTLFNEGGLPENNLKEYEQKVMDQRGEVASTEEELKAREIELQQAKQYPKEIIGTYNRDLLDKLADHRKNIVNLTNQLRKSGVSMKHQVIKSPVDGIVNEQVVRGEGETVTAGESLLSVVPKKSEMFAEIKVTNQDLAYIHKNQRVALRIDAFPYQYFGRLFGSITAISPSSIPDKDGKVFYIIKVKPDRTKMTGIDGETFKLMSGMTLSADIITRKRNILSFFIEPIEKQFDRAFRDPASR